MAAWRQAIHCRGVLLGGSRRKVLFARHYRLGVLMKPPECGLASHHAFANFGFIAAQRRGSVDGTTTLGELQTDPSRAPSTWLPVVTVGAVALAGACLYMSQSSVGVPNDITPMADEVFEWADDLFLFFLDSREEAAERQADMKLVRQALRAQPSLQELRYFYNVRKEGDPPVPDAATLSSPSSSSHSSAATLRVVMYKGQRKKILQVTPEPSRDQIEAIMNFFTPVSENLKKELRTDLEVQRVSGATFAEDVFAQSSPEAPILLQMYEDTCFLCFLMRPFINSVARLLRENGVNLRFKRLNLERNDFPKGCPVARGTPTFVLFRGPHVKAEKWNEFKPKELIQRIQQDWPSLGATASEQMEVMETLVPNRLQLFTQVVMWTIELARLEKMYNEVAPSQSPVGESDHPSDDSSFGIVVSEMMLKDMKLHDELMENLERLKKEVDEIEHDAALVGAMLAEKVLMRERAEQAAAGA